MKATEKISGVLTGKMDYQDLSEAEQSAIRLPIYYIAVEILSLPRQRRASAIDQQPATIQGLLKAEIIRLHKLRK